MGVAKKEMQNTYSKIHPDSRQDARGGRAVKPLRLCQAVQMHRHALEKASSYPSLSKSEDRNTNAISYIQREQLDFKSALFWGGGGSVCLFVGCFFFTTLL